MPPEFDVFDLCEAPDEYYVNYHTTRTRSARPAGSSSGECVPSSAGRTRRVGARSGAPRGLSLEGAPSPVPASARVLTGRRTTVTPGGVGPPVVVAGPPPGTASAERTCMLVRIRSGAVLGVQAIPVDVVNLAPADLRKERPGFDLPIAIGMLAAAEHHRRRRGGAVHFVGELALDGELQPVRGVLPIAAEARRRGVARDRRPAANALEARSSAASRSSPPGTSATLVALGAGRRRRPLPPGARAGAPPRRAGAVPISPTCAGRRREARARGRGRRAAQPAVRRPARLREDDARARLPGDPAAARLRRGARGDRGAQRRRPARGRRADRRRARSARRTTPSPTPGSSAAAASRARARSRSRTTACCSSTSCPSSGATCSRRCASRSRTATSPSRAPAASVTFPARPCSSRR